MLRDRCSQRRPHLGRDGASVFLSSDVRVRRTSTLMIGAMRAWVVAMLVAVSATTPAFAQTKIDPEVQKHFDLGNDLYNEARYEDALVEYEKAYSLSKYWKIL